MALKIRDNIELLKSRRSTLLKQGEMISQEVVKERLVDYQLGKRFFGVLPLKTKTFSYHYLFLDDDNVARHLFLFGPFGYERASSVIFLNLASQLDVVLDLGAFTGLYTLLASVGGRNRRVIAVEANPLNYHRLTENVRLNACNPTLLLQALVPRSSSSDHVDIRFNASLSVLDTGSFVSHEEAQILDQKNNKTDFLTVPAMKLSTLFEEYTISEMNSVLVKLDVEGLELALIKDLLDLCSSQKLIIFVEIIQQKTLEEIYQCMAQTDRYTMAYIDEYDQSISKVDLLSHRRKAGSRNYIIASLDYQDMLLELDVHKLLQDYEP